MAVIMMTRKNKSLYDWCLENNKQYLLSEWMNNLSTKDVTYASNKKYTWKYRK